MWLWARGYEGGGPQAALLRRLAYWLMKEPALDENALGASVEGGRLVVTRQSLAPDDSPVTVIAPDGGKTILRLAPTTGGESSGSVAIAQQGLYHVTDGKLTALAASGPLNPVEFANVVTTADKLAPLVAASGGGIFWEGDGKIPEIRRVGAGGLTAGDGWFGLRRNDAYVVTGFRETPLFPGIAALLLILATLVAAWRREGR
jgi:hypothetical protein